MKTFERTGCDDCCNYCCRFSCPLSDQEWEEILEQCPPADDADQDYGYSVFLYSLIHYEQLVSDLEKLGVEQEVIEIIKDWNEKFIKDWIQANYGPSLEDM